MSSPWEASLLEPEKKQVKKLVEKKAIEKRLGFTEQCFLFCCVEERGENELECESAAQAVRRV